MMERDTVLSIRWKHQPIDVDFDNVVGTSYALRSVGTLIKYNNGVPCTQQRKYLLGIQTVQLVLPN